MFGRGIHGNLRGPPNATFPQEIAGLMIGDYEGPTIMAFSPELHPRGCGLTLPPRMAKLAPMASKSRFRQSLETGSHGMDGIEILKICNQICSFQVWSGENEKVCCWDVFGHETRNCCLVSWGF